jgi:transcription elongation factor Elf1
MSTEVSDPQQRLEDRRRVSELLKKELQGFRCLVCKRNEFVELGEPDDGLQSNLMFYEGGDETVKKYAPLVTIACTHCGRLEQFAQQPLMERVKAGST